MKIVSLNYLRGLKEGGIKIGDIELTEFKLKKNLMIKVIDFIKKRKEAKLNDLLLLIITKI